MKTIYDYEKSYGKKWEFLKSHGWTMQIATVTKGTAYCDKNKKTIFVKKSAFNRPSIRVIKYVIPHEIWHAVHAEVLNYECDDLRLDRDLSWPSALEAVADGGVLFDNRSRTMAAWVRASILWHGKVGYKYKWSDVTSPEVRALVFSINQKVNQTGEQ